MLMGALRHPCIQRLPQQASCCMQVHASSPTMAQQARQGPRMLTCPKQHIWPGPGVWLRGGSCHAGLTEPLHATQSAFRTKSTITAVDGQPGRHLALLPLHASDACHKVSTRSELWGREHIQSTGKAMCATDWAALDRVCQKSDMRPAW